MSSENGPFARAGDVAMEKKSVTKTIRSTKAYLGRSDGRGDR